MNPRSKPVPTLAALRKLAKAKHYEIEHAPGSGEIELLPRADDNRPYILARDYGAEDTGRSHTLSALFAALSVLPDAKKEKQK